MKKHKILEELPKCAKDMSKYCWRNGAGILVRHRVGHKPVTCKTTVYVKCKETRCSCIHIICLHAPKEIHISSHICLLNSTSTVSDYSICSSWGQFSICSMLNPDSVNTHSNICSTLTVVLHLEHDTTCITESDTNEF